MGDSEPSFFKDYQSITQIAVSSGDEDNTDFLYALSDRGYVYCLNVAHPEIGWQVMPLLPPVMGRDQP